MIELYLQKDYLNPNEYLCEDESITLERNLTKQELDTILAQHEYISCTFKIPTRDSNWLSYDEVLQYLIPTRRANRG